MTTYSREERLAAIQKAGIQNPLTALSVSLAEFGDQRDINAQGQSDVPNPNGPNGRENSWGPWQIFLDAHPNVTRSCALDLTCSTQAAAQISKGGTDFGPWSAYKNGSYLRFLDEVKSLIPSSSPTSGGSDGGNGPVGPTGPAAPSGSPTTNTTKSNIFGQPVTGNPLQDFGSTLAGISNAFRPENLWRAGFVVLGGLLIFFGARLYFHQDVGSEQPVGA